MHFCATLSHSKATQWTAHSSLCANGGEWWRCGQMSDSAANDGVFDYSHIRQAQRQTKKEKVIWRRRDSYLVLPGVTWKDNMADRSTVHSARTPVSTEDTEVEEVRTGLDRLVQRAASHLSPSGQQESVITCLWPAPWTTSGTCWLVLDLTTPL